MVQGTSTLGRLVGLSLAFIVCAANGANADENDPPTRVARVAYTEGSVSFQPGGTQDWVAAPINRPLTTGDAVWSDENSRAELQLDGSSIRLSNSSELAFVNLGNEVTQIQLMTGTLILRVWRLDDNESYEVDTPNLAFSVLRPGLYRVSVDGSGSTTSIIARGGQGEVTGGGSAYTVRSGDYDFFSGTDRLVADAQPNAPEPDGFDAWSTDRDRGWGRSRSTRYVSPDVVGAQDLDEYGSWRTTEYGSVWYPRSVAVGWAPYQAGHWSYIAPWGYTWIDDQPWGFAPFHYGRWIWDGGAWGWVPSPPRPQTGQYVRPVYAPALVAWVGAGAGIAWFALGPREVYVPSYPVSANYVRNVNVSNTTVNTTVINNVYNTTIINNKTVDVTYANRAAPGAVTATSTAAFTSAQPVARNLLKVDQRTVADAQVRAIAPALVPTKQAVLGSSREALAKPPVSVQTRSVVARMLPPAQPATFERRQEAIKNNGGSPLSTEQVRQIQPPITTARNAAIRVAPPASPVIIAKTPVKTQPSSAEPAKAERPADQAPPPRIVQVSRPAPAAIHPSELPTPQKPAAPSIADSALEREHLQQQQQLRAQQEQERQRVQQQQELEHQRQAAALADAARKQELERQHQLQTQQLQQKHIQEQQLLQAKQQEARQAAKPNEPHKRP